MHSAYHGWRVIPVVTRGVGVHDAASTLPEWLAPVLGLLTQVGDVWFVFSLLGACYLLVPRSRERIATVIGLALLASALVEGAKHGLGLPRPSTALVSPGDETGPMATFLDATATAGGEGFPSGHATLSTAGFLGLAAALRFGDARRRAVAAIGIVVAVGVTRVGLGVHYLVDVLAGVLLGLAVLAGGALAVRTSPVDPPSTVLALAVGGAALAVGVAPPSATPTGLLAADALTLLVLTGSVGALGGWQLARHSGGSGGHSADRSPSDRRRRRLHHSAGTGRRALVLGVGALLALVVAGVGALAAGEPGALAAAAGGVGVWTGLALPGLVPGFDPWIETATPLRRGAATGEPDDSAAGEPHAGRGRDGERDPSSSGERPSPPESPEH